MCCETVFGIRHNAHIAATDLVRTFVCQFGSWRQPNLVVTVSILFFKSRRPRPAKNSIFFFFEKTIKNNLFTFEILPKGPDKRKSHTHEREKGSGCGPQHFAHCSFFRMKHILLVSSLGYEKC